MRIAIGYISWLNVLLELQLGTSLVISQVPV